MLNPSRKRSRTVTIGLAVSSGLLCAGGLGIRSLAQQGQLGYSDTPMLPGGKWHVHDGARPQPKIIDAGTASTQEAAGRPPSDAIVLFDGKDLSKWRTGRDMPAKWKVENGYMEVVQKGGSISTKDEFGDCQLHIEWSAPTPAKGTSQGRGNSGVMFINGLYEVQVLDSYENQTYPDGQAGAIYGQYPPLVNAMRKPGEWQVYDILFTVPKFKEGKLESPGYFTVIHNGVVLHNHAELMGVVGHKVLPKYSPHAPKGTLVLQDHGQPVRFRNIWLRELKGYDES